MKLPPASISWFRPLRQTFKRFHWVLLASSFLILAYQARTATAHPPYQDPVTRPSIIRGAALWTDNCAPCHGLTGQADGITASALEHPPTNFADYNLAKARTLTNMFEVTKNGRMERMMPFWRERLDDQQIWDVVAYAQSLSVDSTRLEAGQAVYEASCAECHSDADVAESIDLSQPSRLASVSQQTLFDTLRADEDNHVSLNQLSDDALWQSLDFVRTLSLDTPSLEGELTGIIRNETTGTILPNTEITLYALSADGQVLQTETTNSNDEGHFAFSGLNTDHTISYVLESRYQAITYTSPQATVFLPDLPSISQDFVVYETTTDSETIRQQRLHRIMVFNGEQINVADIYIFNAAGNRTYVGETASDGLPGTVKISLPNDATNIDFAESLVRNVNGEYLSAQPLIPEQDTIVTAQYNLPIVNDMKTVELQLFYDVPIINMLIAEQGQTVTSEQLTFQGLQTFQGNDYQFFSGSRLEAGQTLTLQFSGLTDLPTTFPENAPTRILTDNVGQEQTVLMWSLFGLGALVLIFSLVYSGQSQSTINNTSALVAERRHLLAFLAELENLHQQGEIDQNAYQQLKSKNHALLKQILAQLSESDL